MLRVSGLDSIFVAMTARSATNPYLSGDFASLFIARHEVPRQSRGGLEGKTSALHHRFYYGVAIERSPEGPPYGGGLPDIGRNVGRPIGLGQSNPV